MIPEGICLKKVDTRRSAASDDDVLWDRVTSIEPFGEMSVYDATVKGTHNFIADGIVAHNSLEQDADQVLFLHRPSTESSSREAILAKNRMGPADVTVRLAWEARRAMFGDL